MNVSLTENTVNTIQSMLHFQQLHDNEKFFKQLIVILFSVVLTSLLTLSMSNRILIVFQLKKISQLKYFKLVQ